LKLARFPRSLAATLTALPSMSLIPISSIRGLGSAPSRISFGAFAETIFISQRRGSVFAQHEQNFGGSFC
jgi:hypothetical protein